MPPSTLNTRLLKQCLILSGLHNRNLLWISRASSWSAGGLPYGYLKSQVPFISWLHLPLGPWSSLHSTGRWGKGMKDSTGKLLMDQAGSSTLHFYSHSIGHDSVTQPQPNCKEAGKMSSHCVTWKRGNGPQLNCLVWIAVLSLTSYVTLDTLLSNFLESQFPHLHKWVVYLMGWV